MHKTFTTGAGFTPLSMYSCVHCPDVHVLLRSPDWQVSFVRSCVPAVLLQRDAVVGKGVAVHTMPGTPNGTLQQGILATNGEKPMYACIGFLLLHALADILFRLFVTLV